METQLASALEKQVWMTNYFQEYVRESGFMPYMGRSPRNIIISKYELQDEAGKTINIPFIARLKGDGVTGSGVLSGNEEELNTFNCAVSIDWRRNAVKVPKSTQYKTEINLLDAGKDGLRTWEAEKLRDDVIKAMLSVITTGDTTVDWGSATAGNKNSFAAGNADRLLFGATKSNYSATWSTAFGTNIDTAADKCTVAQMSLARRMARQADPHIRPFKTTNGREYYVAFHGSRTFRDLKSDSTMTQANRDARPRSVEENPLFQDGDLIYDGLLHREVPEIDDMCTSLGGFDAAGAASCDVRPVFICGQGSVAIAWGQEPTPRTDMLADYSFRPGVAIEELLGVKKIAFNGKQNGMLTAFCAAAADS